MLNREFKKKIIFDFVLVLLLLAISLSVYFLVYRNRAEGSVVRVTVDGEVVGEYPLSIDAEYTFNGGTNVLKIEGGKAYLISANCPDHLCVKQGKVDESGETITCLPNRLTVTVYGSDRGVDLIS